MISRIVAMRKMCYEVQCAAITDLTALVSVAIDDTNVVASSDSGDDPDYMPGDSDSSMYSDEDSMSSDEDECFMSSDEDFCVSDDDELRGDEDVETTTSVKHTSL